MKMIVAVNNHGFIGKNGDLMWYCREDLQHFKKLTIGCKCLVGRRTFDMLPPLIGREMIVVGSYYKSLEVALSEKPDWIIGGGKIYEQTLDLCDELHISIINDNQIGDTKFPDYSKFKGKIYYYYFEPNSTDTSGKTYQALNN